MSEWFVQTCIKCRQFFRIGNMEVYRGDKRYCRACNAEIERQIRKGEGK